MRTDYIKGYEDGYTAGKRDGIYCSCTPNKIREAFGLP